MPLTTQGFGDLEDDLAGMAAALTDGAGIDRALQAGAAPIEAQMRQNATSDPKVISGDLRDSIHTGPVRKRKNGGKRITVGVHTKEKGAFYANPLEFGHGGPAPAPAHPFVRPAFDTAADEAYTEIKRVLRDELK
ncbi:MAG TPA: HK97 gp10 family phage protein [Candidatus Limiplasma sp.]|nr:HK97 gp10 family phage protein [Candidatus Limiplasma sp.]